MEEIIFMPNFLFKTNGGEVIYEEYKSSEQNENDEIFKLPQVIPKVRKLDLTENIGKLKYLKRIVLSSNVLKSLPENIASLTKLEELFIDETQIDINEEWEHLKEIPNLKLLSVVGCEVDKNLIDKIKYNWEGIKLITRKQDEIGEKERWFEIQEHEEYHLFFRNDIMSDYFYNTLPLDYKKKLGK